MNIFLHTVGWTDDGRRVVAGVFRFTETYGMPLDVVLQALHGIGAVVAWPTYVEEALAAGMRRDRVLARVREAVSDVHGAAHAEVVCARLAEATS